MDLGGTTWRGDNQNRARVSPYSHDADAPIDVPESTTMILLGTG